jgi:hypothetical protein
MMYDVFEVLTVNIPLKIFVCFLLSAFVLVGMVFYFYESVVNEPVELSMLVAVFLTLFLFFFFCFNMRQIPVDKMETLAGADEKEPSIQDYIPELPSLNDHENDYEEPEELASAGPEVGSDIPDQKKVFVNQTRVSNIQLAFGDDDVPYLVESSGLELVDGDLGEIVRFIHSVKPAELEELSDTGFAEEAEPLELLDIVSAEENDAVEAAELEDISSGFSDGSIIIFKQPFAYSLSNPELLHGAASQVIYEQNGIHYINNNFDGEGIDKTWDNNFARLVESVLAPSAPRN